ncbi:MAG TPA: lysophospholipid acyltransferase family protein [Burkholderiaceae bacterium]|nr:lysophospholipid acyltransferase family protein [Burkholderiaceae bacterium]
MIASLVARAIIVFVYLVTGVRARWLGCAPAATQRVYFANHASHGDFVLVWSVMPPVLRKRTRPVAGADYWNRSALRRFIGASVFNAVLIDRDPQSRTADPVAMMEDALAGGDSLIIFPEGTRNTGDTPLLPLKSGLFHLASRRPDIEYVPVWIENIGRVLPKGMLLPVPLLCSVSFGSPLTLTAGESRDQFLSRARSAMLAMRPRSTSEVAPT